MSDDIGAVHDDNHQKEDDVDPEDADDTIEVIMETLDVVGGDGNVDEASAVRDDSQFGVVLALPSTTFRYKVSG